MVNSTDTYWSVNGVSLQTLAFNVSTWGGDLQAPPPLRGGDLVIPYRPGEVFQTRRPSGRSMTFNMWVLGADVNGKIPTNMTMRAQFESNLKLLRNLFWNQGRQVSITKRWKEPGSSVVQTATAKAIFSGGFAPTMNGALRATYSVEMYLSDPFFYGDEETVNFSATSAPTVNITVPGDYETTVATMQFNGARDNMRLTNLSEGVYVNVNNNVVAGSEIVLDIDNWTALKNPGGTFETNVIGSVTNLGHEFWFALQPGAQQLRVTSGSGTGSAVLKYKPRWL